MRTFTYFKVDLCDLDFLQAMEVDCYDIRGVLYCSKMQQQQLFTLFAL